MNKSKSTERPGRKKLTDKQPATKGYAPIDHRWYERPRDLPPFTFRTIRDMLLEPTIRLGLKMRAAPMCGIEFAYKKPGSDEYTPGIQADDQLVAAFVERQLKRIWNDITHLLDAQIWGWAAAELMFRMIDSTAAGRCFLEIDRLLPRHAVDVRILVQDGEPKAVRFMRIKEQPQGHVDVEFPKAVFHTHAPEPGQHYGTSILTGAHSPWADKWLNGGALDVRRLFMTKDAYRGAKLWYPNEIYEIEGKGPVPARDIAREIVEQAKAGAIVTLPSGDYPNGGSKKWDWEESSTNSNPQHILQYPKDLDTEMLRGMEVPDDIFTAEADTSGSWGDKKVPLAAFYGGLDIWATKLLRDLKEQIVDRLVKYNFGPGHWYEIKHKPLADQAMENQAKSGPGGGGNPFQPQRPPQFGGFGRDGDGDGEHGESGNGLPKRMGLAGHGVDPVEAVGRGVLGAAELVEAAGRVIKLRVESNSATESPHEFSSTQFNITGDLAYQILRMSETIHVEDLAPDGREQNPHVTVKYGLHTNDPEEVQRAVSDFPPVAIQFGKTSVFSSPKHDVVKIEVLSKGLHELNAQVAESLDHTNTFPDYKPHVTIAYVKPGLGQKYADRMNNMEGQVAVFDRLTFSNKSREWTSIPLTGKALRFSVDA